MWYFAYHLITLYLNNVSYISNLVSVKASEGTTFREHKHTGPNTYLGAKISRSSIRLPRANSKASYITQCNGRNSVELE